MGEISDDLIDGICCSYCNQYFIEEHGYPVICKKCWDEATDEERKVYQEAIHDEI